jgi:hypothetical protein
MAMPSVLLRGAIVLAALLLDQQAGATEVAADALKDLATGKTWFASNTISGNQATSWSWKADGTVCMWIGSPSGKCSDDGTWKIVDKRICYRLTWWGKSYDMMSACFSVMDLGDGSYEATLPSGTFFLKFRVSP